jgi:hypothetical protein
VHDQIGVGVSHSGEQLQEQREAGRYIQASLIAPGIDRRTIHVLEDQVRLAGSAYAGVEQPGDVGMGQPGKQIAFGPEAGFAPGTAQCERQELDRAGALETTIVALGQPNRSHPALADGPFQSPWSERPRLGRVQQFGCRPLSSGIQETFGLRAGIALEHQPELRGNVRAFALEVSQPRGARSRVEIQCGIE